MRSISLAVGLALVTTLIAGGVAPSAQTRNKRVMTDADYSTTMKQVASTFESLKDNDTVMEHEKGAKDAQKLQGLLKDVQAYWEAKHVDDAVGFAKAGVAAAADIEKSSTSMDMDMIERGEDHLARACQDCHAAHRVKRADGSYMIRTK